MERWDPGEPRRDISPGTWLQDRLWTWGPGSERDGLAVGCLVPEGFAAYGRVLHPAERLTARGLESVRWSTVASWTGRIAHPLMQFHPVANLSWPDSPAWGVPPSVGSLPSAEAQKLIDTLRAFTTTPDRCYLGLWEGFGVPELRAFDAYPRLRMTHRNYFLFAGPIDGVPWLTLGDFRQSPNLWWPEDRAWVVATEIDSYDTYVAATAACVERIVADPALEAYRTTVEARADTGSDVINTSRPA
jgi:hypothetical protein